MVSASILFLLLFSSALHCHLNSRAGPLYPGDSHQLGSHSRTRRTSAEVPGSNPALTPRDDHHVCSLVILPWHSSASQLDIPWQVRVPPKDAEDPWGGLGAFHQWHVPQDCSQACAFNCIPATSPLPVPSAAPGIASNQELRVGGGSRASALLRILSPSQPQLGCCGPSPVLLESKEVKPEAGNPISWEKGPLTALESSLTSQTTFHLLGLLFRNLGGPSVWPEDLLTHSLLPRLPPGVPDSGGLGWDLRDGLCKERPRGADAARPGPRL